MGFLGEKEFEDPLAAKNWRLSTISALWQPCANCGETKTIEMHHLKHIKSINVKLDSFGKIMSKINRKQVPLCRPCHERVHNGTYDGMSLKHFNYIRWEGKPKWS
jgi:5-methylcytosine-specific restriction endonuclease McrA